MTLKVVTTRSRWFTCIRLLWYSPDGIAVPPFPVTFTTMALYHSSLRWFEASTCMAASRGPPSSSIKHGLKFPSSPSWHTATPDSGLLLFLTMHDLLSLLALDTLEYGFSRSEASPQTQNVFSLSRFSRRTDNPSNLHLVELISLSSPRVDRLQPQLSVSNVSL